MSTKVDEKKMLEPLQLQISMTALSTKMSGSETAIARNSLGILN